MGEVRGHTAGPGIVEQKRYDVLRIDPSHGPLYVLVPSIDGDDEHRAFCYEEHDCPKDILARIEDVVAGGDTDPHHIIEFVRTIDVTWEYPCNPAEVLRPLIPEAFSDSGRLPKGENAEGG